MASYCYNQPYNFMNLNSQFNIVQNKQYSEKILKDIHKKDEKLIKLWIIIIKLCINKIKKVKVNKKR